MKTINESTIELQRALGTIPVIIRIHLVKIVSFPTTFPKHSKVSNAYSFEPEKQLDIKACTGCFTLLRKLHC